MNHSIEFPERLAEIEFIEGFSPTISRALFSLSILHFYERHHCAEIDPGTSPLN